MFCNSIVQNFFDYCWSGSWLALEGHTGDYVPVQLRARVKESTIDMSDLTATFVLLDGALLPATIAYFDQLNFDMTVRVCSSQPPSTHLLPELFC